MRNTSPQIEEKSGSESDMNDNYNDDDEGIISGSRNIPVNTVANDPNAVNLDFVQYQPPLELVPQAQIRLMFLISNMFQSNACLAKTSRNCQIYR